VAAGAGAATHGHVVGTCEDMCPAAERALRERVQDIQVFEQPEPGNPGRTSAALAVKRFARSVRPVRAAAARV
jgi:nuclear mRNA export protein SAC3